MLLLVLLLHVSSDDMMDLSSSFFLFSFLLLLLISWSWGWNKYGQVGNDSAEDALKPQLIQLPRSPSQKQQQYVRSITAGLRHTIALTASQQLFGWGLLHLTSSSSTTSTAEAQPQVSAQAPPVSFVPKNIGHCVPSLSSSSSPSDSLYLALAGSSSSSLSFVALDMCSSSRGVGGSVHDQSRRAVVGRRSEQQQQQNKKAGGISSSSSTATTADTARAPPIARTARSLSKSPVRRATGPDTTAAPMAAARRKDTARKQQQQQFNTVLYKVDKPTANSSQVRCLCWLAG